MMTIVGTLAYEYEVSLPVFGEHSLAGGADEYAWLTAGFGAGSIAAGVFLLFWPQTGLTRMAMISGAYGVTLGLTAAALNSLVANVTIVFVGACSIGFLTTGNSTVQLFAPAGMRGRVTALWTTAFIGTTPIGAVIVGGVGQAFGGRASLFLAAAACLTAAGVGALIGRIRPRDDAPPTPSSPTRPPLERRP
ncbi:MULTISPECIES: MFS transporter [unclassified Microbacterium]|uniref:MFS transporter n=1 Tax=unclassified Microbacterium TaxID=2609290 RepID=UPI00214ADDF0|nr:MULTISPECIES: MFS transporter [unclassified Microbacterium]MCR2809262.1 MFS transporter [Microbacterium sp. zg.B185]WIM20405.1 MFS transporter [Microbacterium sp. zg-B185]